MKEEEVTGSEVKLENGTAEVSENGTQEKGEFPYTNNFIEFHLFCSRWELLNQRFSFYALNIFWPMPLNLV